MSLHVIQNVEGLRRHLYAALQLEHATIPPYLTALYSIRPGTNAEAAQIIRTVAVEEMLHLTLVGNVLNAIGGRVDLTRPGFVPAYPAYLPDGETDFQVSLQRFSPEAVETFLRIERPASLDAPEIRTVSRTPHPSGIDAARVSDAGEEHFYSIGEFYKAIESGLKFLHAQMGDKLFCGDRSRQIGPEYYYSGGSGLIEVTDIDSALAALELIAEQGEGIHADIFDEDGEIAHYYRFHQLVAGKYYQPGDSPHEPSGAPVPVDWSAVYPVRTNARLDRFSSADLRESAAAFNTDYARFLKSLTEAFDGKPDLFLEAVGDMFRLKDAFGQLVRTPLGDDETAAPTFEIDAAMEALR
ncbi:ferritin-like domain-containing protein [Roseisalinus antarcticus]|uniref:Oxygen-dependent dichlorochromopyrrolate synthase n=1 Tax=Roseisalinus antarcticus TaxID=254357 RepID=A0A1Y5T1X0_9RHOB|nr:ferritin-like protein [Roseisalinus antarcticus]SLN52163.1 Oxygen-dependent dichlorochromopyrrolate synthase [Roseisalinus antarcticus]